MAVRYQRVFLFTENLYVEGAPVLINAGGLLLDKVTGNVLAQLKFQSVSKQVIKAIKVVLQPLDTVQRVLGSEVEFQYLDLNAMRDAQFGSKIPIRMPDATTRAFTVRVTEVAFTDNTVWNCSDPWCKIPAPKKITDVLSNELKEQYRMAIGATTVYSNKRVDYVTERVHDLWRCTCGAINHVNEENCHACQQAYDKLVVEFDVEKLTFARNERLAELERKREAERIRREEELARQEAERIKREEEQARIAHEAELQRLERKRKAKKRRKKLLIILLVVILIAILAFGALCFLNWNVVSESVKNFFFETVVSKTDAKEIAVGAILQFGNYEQDNNKDNGQEPIEWIVLDAQDGQALLLSRYALDAKQYNAERTGMTWEESSVRTWLNEDFVQTAFSQVEQDTIVTSTVPANDNPTYDTDAGNATQDQMFLLDIDQANAYFQSDTERQCQPTAYAQAQDLEVGSNGYCKWWLRTPGQIAVTAGIVTTGGEIDVSGYGVTNNLAIRPAMWIDLTILDVQ